MLLLNCIELLLSMYIERSFIQSSQASTYTIIKWTSLYILGIQLSISLLGSEIHTAGLALVVQPAHLHILDNFQNTNYLTSISSNLYGKMLEVSEIVLLNLLLIKVIFNSTLLHCWFQSMYYKTVVQLVNQNKYSHKDWTRNIVVQGPATLELEICGYLKIPEIYCHHWVTWESIEQLLFKHLIFLPCKLSPHMISQVLYEQCHYTQKWSYTIHPHQS